MILILILLLLLFCNWLINEALVFLPLNLLAYLTSWEYWLMAILIFGFFAWCMAEDS